MAALIAGINVREADVAVPYLQNEAFDRTFDGVVISDLKGNIQFVNTTFAALHGYSERELRGKHLSLFHTEEQMNQEVIPFLEKAKMYGHHQGVVGHVKKDGSTFSTRMSSNVLKNDRDVPIGLIVIIDDGCNHLKLEKKQQSGQKTHHTKTPARKIAHDFNNFLNVIIGNIDLTIRTVPEHSQVRSNLEEVLVASTRAQDLVQEILTASRRDNHELKPLQVPLVVRETLRLLRPSLPTSIELSENICNGNGSVLADPAQIQRIIMNLCTNGYHAMEQTGGKLNVTIIEIDIDPADSVRLNVDPGAYVCLSVSDTGHGIEHEDINKIFDPYYTTKERGKGNGLGLSIVGEVVKSYGGDVKVYSESGKGTVIDVYLPRFDYDAYCFETALKES